MTENRHGVDKQAYYAAIVDAVIRTDRGGALVDADGKLIGINTLITSYSGNYSGVGFAIPVNYAVNLAQQIIDGKTPTHAQLGVSLSTVNAQSVFSPHYFAGEDRKSTRLNSSHRL